MDNRHRGEMCESAVTGQPYGGIQKQHKVDQQKCRRSRALNKPFFEPNHQKTSHQRLV